MYQYGYPLRLVSIYGDSQHGSMGLSLWGSFLYAGDTAKLERALRQLLALGAATIWVDCRHLEQLTWQGQRALLHADRVARGLNSTIFWCGFPAPLEEQLHTSGLYSLLHIVPAEQYQGPRLLLLGTAPVSPSIFSIVVSK